MPGSRTENINREPVPEGFEDEDMELQAILQASITGVDVLPTRFISRGDSSGGPIVRSPAEELPHDELEFEEPVNDDPVASSLARSKAIMEQMLREQEAAFRVNYDGEVRGIQTANRWDAFARSSGSQQPTRERTRGEEDEDEEIRKAIEASKTGLSPQDVVSDDSEGEEQRPGAHSAELSAQQRFADHTGVYDDDDEALQAALRASLEDAPGGTPIPEEPPRRPLTEERSQQTRGVEEDRVMSRTMSKAIAEDEDEDMDDDAEEEQGKVDKGKGKETEQQPEPVDVDEMRKRRLARFGGGG